MDIYTLLEGTLAYRYHYGVRRRHFSVHRTPENTYRSLPFLALVQPFDGPYHFSLVETRTVYVAQPGEIVFVPAYVPHCLHQPAAGRHTAVHIQYSVLGALDPLSLFTVPYRIGRTAARGITDVLDRLVAANEAPVRTLDAVLDRTTAAFELLRFILQHSAINNDKTALLGRFTRIQPVLEYIDRNLGGRITRDFLAEIASLSPARFNYLFREIMGMPPKKYVQMRRQKRALELLRDTDLAIEEVAERCGYCDQFYFSNRFKKELGVSPSAFRQGLKKQDWVFSGA